MSSSFKYTSYIVDILRKIIGSNFNVSGLENIPQDQPIMFAANHFTRSETFFVPYLINKYTKRHIRSLADHSLFHGFLGKFLTKLGTVSTKDKNRDKIIIKDLVENNHDWLIYPEGSMIKNKKIVKKNLYITHTPYGVSAVRTGTSVLALKSELYRQDFINSTKAENNDITNYVIKKYNLKYDDSLQDLSTYIVPISITYYPIRPNENKATLFAKKWFDALPKRVAEELKIEANLLSKAKIHLHFCENINLKEYINKSRNLIYQLPIIKNETKSNLVIKYHKNSLTTEFMKRIYSNIEINLDHIFSAVLRHIKRQKISIIDLKRIVFISFYMIEKTNKYNLNKEFKNNLINLFNDESHSQYDDIFNLALKLKEIVKINKDELFIDKKSLFLNHDFHNIRLKSTLQVIYNEFSLFSIANNIVKRNSSLKSEVLKEKVSEYILEYDLKNYDSDYKKYYDPDFSKDKEIGQPYFLKPLKEKSKKIGILICHGYKSSPREVLALSKFLCDKKYYIYAVRLKGHATSPKNIKDITYQDWINSVNVGYSVLNNVCDEIIMIGFSTGGLLSLFISTQKNKNLKAIISINAALRLHDIRAKFVPAINLWNELLEKFNINKARLEYIDDEPENPLINYSRNYLHGVEELNKLMKKCEKNLNKISAPTLVIQAKNDPVIKSSSGKIIYNKISSETKELYEPDFSNHVIINNKGKEKIFDKIYDFIDSL